MSRQAKDPAERGKGGVGMGNVIGRGFNETLYTEAFTGIARAFNSLQLDLFNLNDEYAVEMMDVFAKQAKDVATSYIDEMKTASLNTRAAIKSSSQEDPR